uniref:INB domain-containing protein n=1 Tax=Heterorhabditis bacteriophora TaxID=37862 RepID=A0A1I7X055_HETBA
MRTITKNFRLGFGSFIDKKLMPFIDPRIEKIYFRSLIVFHILINKCKRLLSVRAEEYVTVDDANATLDRLIEKFIDMKCIGFFIDHIF